MLRAVVYFLIFVVAVSVIRAVLNAFGNLFGTVMQPPPAPQAPRGPSPAPGQQEVLQKDPVCGTFVAPSTAFQKASGGKTYYFCSMQCRDRFKG